MNFYNILFSVLFLVVAAQAKIEFSQNAKDCIQEINSDEDTIRSLVTEDSPVPEDNELVQRFFGCIFKNYIGGSNELIVNDKLISYVTEILAARMQGKRKLAALVAKDCLEHCKSHKGDTKGKTAAKVMNCLKRRFDELLEK